MVWASEHHLDARDVLRQCKEQLLPTKEEPVLESWGMERLSLLDTRFKHFSPLIFSVPLWRVPQTDLPLFRSLIDNSLRKFHDNLCWTSGVRCCSQECLLWRWGWFSHHCFQVMSWSSQERVPSSSLKVWDDADSLVLLFHLPRLVPSHLGPLEDASVLTLTSNMCGFTETSSLYKSVFRETYILCLHLWLLMFLFFFT